MGSWFRRVTSTPQPSMSISCSEIAREGPQWPPSAARAYSPNLILTDQYKHIATTGSRCCNAEGTTAQDSRHRQRKARPGHVSGLPELPYESPTGGRADVRLYASIGTG